jgi:hypothetical protein
MKLRYTIRDLMWFTLVLALCALYWRDHRTPPSTRYQVRQSADGKNLVLIDTDTGVSLSMPSDSLDRR